jgi:hypothetical protein
MLATKHQSRPDTILAIPDDYYGDCLLLLRRRHDNRIGEESTVTCFQVQHGERHDVALVTRGESSGTVCSHAEIVDNCNQLRMLRDGCPRATPINCLNQRAQIPSIRYVKKSQRPHASISRGCTPHFPISQRCTQSITAVAEAGSTMLLRQAYSLGILDVQTFFRDWPRVETKII